MSINHALWVALGGALGSLARFWMSGWVAVRFGESLPVGTLLVNALGSFVIGLFAGLTDPDGRWLVQPGVRQFVMAGVCGGFTTFSSFSLQTLHLVRAGEWFWAGWNVAGSVFLCLAAVWLGSVCALLFSGR